MARRARDLRKRNLRRAIRVEQTVDLLERVRELRVAEPAEERRFDDGDDEIAVTRREVLVAARGRIAPRSPVECSPRHATECDAAEFREHDRLAAVWIAVEREHAPPGRLRSNSCAGSTSLP